MTRLGRDFLKDTIRQRVDFSATDQHRGVRPPPPQKPCPPGAERVALPDPDGLKRLARISLWNAIRKRRSVRSFSSGGVTIEELSWLLWATQGVCDIHGHSTLRTVPSAGARHALETYICVFRVKGMDSGIYRFLPVDHALCRVASPADLEGRLIEGCLNQQFAGRSAVTFVWSALPYRMEWRYGAASYKVLAMDAGHACQNLYLACEAIGCGTCAIGAYDQRAMDRLLGLDGEDEFVIYAAPVGKSPSGGG